MRRLWLAGCQVRACLSAPWSLGKVNVPLNQTSGRPSPLSAGRCCSLPAELKVHSHLLPETYPETQNGVRYALIKLSWVGLMAVYGGAWWWRGFMLLKWAHITHGIMHLSDARRGFLFIGFHKVYFIYRLSLHIKDDFNTVKAWRDLFNAALLFRHLERKHLWWEHFLFWIKKPSVDFFFSFSHPGIKTCSIKDFFFFFFYCSNMLLNTAV